MNSRENVMAGNGPELAADGKTERLWSLDALRGFDMLFISGLGGIVYELAILIFGGSDAWLAQQMKHVAWEGFHHHDTIFPLFIFLAGVSYPFSCAAARARGLGNRELVWKAVRRMVMLVLLGLVYQNILQFDFAHQRWASVLARIGMAWFGAAMIYLFVKGVGRRIAITLALLVGYWAVCFFLVAPDAPAGAGSFSPEGCFAGYVDRLLLGSQRFDPEGVLSVFPSVALAMCGIFAGELVRRTDVSGGRKAALLAGLGALCLAMTFAWMPWCPVIKKIWTPTFITAAAAYSFFCFALFYWIVDVLRFRRWTFFFRVVGMNALTVYLFNRIVPVPKIAGFFFGGVISLFPAAYAGLMTNVSILAVAWLFLYFLYRKGVFLKV